MHNRQRALPYVRAWAEKYKDQGLVVIGVHAPEFAFERKVDNVKRAAGDLGLHFPIAIDNDFAIWRSFNNQYWPPTTSSMHRDASAFTILAKASTNAPSR